MVKQSHLFFLRSELGTGAGLLKNVEKKIALFFLRSELGTGAGLLKNLEKKIALFFCGLNLEQVLAYRKMWRKNRTFFFAV